MTFDNEFIEITESLNSIYHELARNFDEEDLNVLLDLETDIVKLGCIYSFMKERLSSTFLFSTIKIILNILPIMDDYYKDKP